MGPEPKRKDYAADSGGELEWLAAVAAWRRERGRAALVDDAVEWRPEPKPKAKPAAGEPDDEAAEEPDAVKYDHVLIPRIVGKIIRQVPISLPEDFPVTPLGKNGRSYFYLTPLGELVALQDAEHGQAHIRSLCAPEINALNRAFPQFNQQGRFKGFQANYAADALTAACARKGIFQAHDKVRGLGCWRAEDGTLIQHLGDRILVGGREEKPGEVDRFVYPGRPPMPAGVAGGRDAVAQVYRRFRSWNWTRGDLDARLLLGQLASTILGAALEWRPMAFITGDASTGKSTLQRMVRDMLPGRLVGTVDASEAALRGLLGQDAVGVSFDEIEADASNEKAQQVMKLARTAASGDDAYRSSASQDLKQFTLRGSFLFSAIIPPSMRPQDMQRFAFLMLRTLPKDAKVEPSTLADRRALGAALVGRITSAWPAWEATLDAFAMGLARQGHAQRAALQFGTLLAAAHLVLEDHAPSEADVDQWCAQLRRETLFEYSNAEPVWLKALRRVLSAQPEIWRDKGFPTVAEMVRRYLDLVEKKGGDAEAPLHPDTARRDLNRVGLDVIKQKVTGRMLLAIPPRHQQIAAMFRGSDFQAAGGGEGAWHIPMSMAPAIEGAPNERRGVYHSEKSRRLDQRCDMFWLDGQAEIAGVWTPIFERALGADELDGPPAPPAAPEREPGEEG